MSTLRIARPAIALLTGAAVAAQLLTGIPAEAADTAPVNVTVNTRAGLAAVSDTAVGTNHAIWDTNLGTNETADLLKAAGVKMPGTWWWSVPVSNVMPLPASTTWARGLSGV